MNEHHQINTVADALRHGADIIDRYGWWDGSPVKTTEANCALTSLRSMNVARDGMDSVRARCAARIYMGMRVEAMGYTDEAGHKPAVAVWNDSHDQEHVTKHMRAWADDYEEENPWAKSMRGYPTP